jgi:hypothetical protein
MKGYWGRELGMPPSLHINYINLLVQKSISYTKGENCLMFIVLQPLCIAALS